MKIDVRANNLKGMFDNGFTHIYKFAYFPDEREVLINAFNVFKVISFKKANKHSKAHLLEL